MWSALSIASMVFVDPEGGDERYYSRFGLCFPIMVYDGEAVCVTPSVWVSAVVYGEGVVRDGVLYADGVYTVSDALYTLYNPYAVRVGGLVERIVDDILSGVRAAVPLLFSTTIPHELSIDRRYETNNIETVYTVLQERVRVTSTRHYTLLDPRRMNMIETSPWRRILKRLDYCRPHGRITPGVVVGDECVPIQPTP